MLIITIVLTSIVFVNCYTQNCAVGLLHDNNDWIKRIAFAAETKRIGFESTVELIDRLNSYNTLTVTCQLISSNNIAIFGPQFEDNAQIVQSVCDSTDIPHIETRWDDLRTKSSSTVNLYPHAPTLSQALADLVMKRDWQTFTIFYEDNESLSRITGILKMKRDYAINIKQLSTDGSNNYRPVLKEASRAGHTHFILDCQIDHLPDVLQQAQQVGLMTSQNYYIITNLDLQTIDLDPYKHSDTNITGVRIVDPEAWSTKLLTDIINDEAKEAEFEEIQTIESWQITTETALLIDGINLLKMAVDDLPELNRCNTESMCSINAPSSRHGASLINSMKTSYSFEGITGLVKLDSDGFRKEFGLDIVELTEDGIKKVAIWNSTDGITFMGDEDAEDLKNQHFTVITTLTEPYGMLTDSAVQLYGNARYEGFAIDLIHELSLIEKFNYTFTIRVDKSNGSKNNKTGKWDGMIGDLMNGDADLAITDLTITSERETAVDFTMPFMNLGISILYKKPQKAPPNFFSFAEPFAVEVWLWLGGAYFIVSVSLFIMGRLCPSEWNNPYPCVEEPEFLINQFSLRNSFWFTIGSLMQQGTEIAPIAFATRMTAGIWWFFTLIMVSSYTANLAAFLATENPDIQFNDVFELLEKSDKLGIKFGAKAKGATSNFFRDSKIPEFIEIYKIMDKYEKDVMVSDNTKGVLKAEQEAYAFFMESVSIEYEIERHCNLTQVGGYLDEKGYGIAMRKDSSYRHKLSTAVLKLQENGKIAELKRKWWEERKGGGQCTGEGESQDAKPLTLKNVGGVFWVTVGGSAIAIALVFVETILHIFKESLKHASPFCPELKEEMKFYMRFSGLVKPVRLRKSSSKSPDESKHSEKTQEEEDEEDKQPTTYGFLPDIAKPPLE